MALPTLSKTWQFNVNNQTTAQGTALADCRKTLRGIKDAMIGFATNPWTVRYSCDSVTAGTAGDGVDRWSADTNLVWANAGTAHSWIVLRQTGIGTTYELLISCENATPSNLTLLTSISGFSGGSTTARPTATDELTVASSVQWIAGTDVSNRWSVMQSTDGQCTRILVGYSGNFTTLIVLDKPNNPTTGWSTPNFSALYFASGGLNTNTTGVISATSPVARSRIGSTNGSVSLTIEGMGNNFSTDTAIGNIANEVDSSWDMWPLGIACITSGVRGRHGSLFDLWAVSTVRASGDMIPADGSNQFAVFGSFVLPWNGSAAPAFS